MTQRAQSVVSTSRFLLAAIWFTALVSIPSRASYQEQLDSGAKPGEITTMFDTVSLFVSIAMVLAWLTTSRWLRELVEATPQPALKPAWAMWGWIVPVVSLWFPRTIVSDLLSRKTQSERIPVSTWWLTWLGFVFTSNFGIAIAMSSTSTTNPIMPQFEIASACLLTASYQVWVRIVTALDSPSV